MQAFPSWVVLGLRKSPSSSQELAPPYISGILDIHDDQFCQMCGILFSYTNQQVHKSSDSTHEYLRRRGPDCFKTIHRQVEGERPDSAVETDTPISYLTFVATVLSLRGDRLVEQPLEDEQSGSILCWNGEAWKLNDTTVVGNDAVAIMSLLVNAIESHSIGTIKDATSEEEASQAVSDVMTSISGPYAFVFYDAQYQRIFYGRDTLGRRSLLQKIHPDGGLSLSSISQSPIADCIEVEAGFIYRMDLASSTDTPRDADHDTVHARSSINIPSNQQNTRIRKIHFLVQTPNNPPLPMIDKCIETFLSRFE